MLHVAVETNPSTRAVIRTNHTEAPVWKRVGSGEIEFNLVMAIQILEECLATYSDQYRE